MALDPRTPVLVGGGQVNQRTAEGDPAREPVDLIVEAARRAADDAGTDGKLLEAIDAIRVVSLLSWRYRDPGALVAERIGASPKETAVTTPGGNTPQSLVNRTALDIMAGRNDVVLIGGAEAWRTRMSFRSTGDRPAWTEQDGSVREARVIGDEFTMTHPAEMNRGIVMPVQVYPMFEQAVRASQGRSIDDHLVRISELWSRFSEVASKNPNAWLQRTFTPEEIRTPGPDNRWIGFPYPKLMNSNNNVEQGGVLLMCSAAAAERFGVPRERWVFPHAGADAHDTDALSHRGDLHSSPAIRAVGRQTLDLAGVGIDDVKYIDLYSCFPSAVEIAAGELGLPVDDPSRPLTVTGGLSFAGGPWNNYVTHAIATMMNVLRNDPGSYGLCSANGGFITKHAIGVYSTDPPEDAFKWGDAQNEADRFTQPRDVAPEDYDGDASIETWTVMHNREGEPENGIAAAMLDDGRRTWGTTQDPDVLKAMTVEEFIGRPVRLDGNGGLIF
ncbi:MAG TPA: acetyl-CoA acetyltransferase [Acidimicrobiales bacterium]|nr:acetyl-CoA acetyltransferase [Acidimicrobiales bacterium]